MIVPGAQVAGGWEERGGGKVRLGCWCLLPTVQRAHSGLRFAMVSFGPSLGPVLSPVPCSVTGLEALLHCCCCCCRASCMAQMLSGRM